MLKNISTLICEVTDMDSSVAFYQDLLGFRGEMVTPHWSSLTFGDFRIGLHPPFHGSSSNSGGWILGIEVEDLADLRRLLLEKGHETGGYHDIPGGVVLDFTDPDGNRIQAMQSGAKAAELS